MSRVIHIFLPLKLSHTFFVLWGSYTIGLILNKIILLLTIDIKQYLDGFKINIYGTFNSECVFITKYKKNNKILLKKISIMEYEAFKKI